MTFVCDWRNRKAMQHPVAVAKTRRKRAVPGPAQAVPHSLQHWLPRSGLTLQQFATKVGIHYSTASEIFRGRRWPDPDTALRILEATDGAVTAWDVSWYRANRRVHAARKIGQIGGLKQRRFGA